MESRKELAVNKKRNGYNCAQAVACSFCDYAGIEEEQMKRITQAFGVGMGTMEGTCGAITGANVVLGLKNGGDRGKTVTEARKIMTDFQNQNGAVTCKVLKGIETGKMLRNCEDCVRDAVELLEKALQ